MKNIMTPLQLQMLLHYYVTNEPYCKYDYHHANSKTVSEQRYILVNMGLIEDNSDAGYKTTDKGEFYITALCNVPLPIQKWEIPKE